MTFKFELGVTVEHLIHGYEGIVVARAEHITGCNRYTVQAKGLNKDYKPKEAYWMDEHALKLTKAKKLVIERDAVPFKFDLGVTVKHLVHGLEGVVIGRADELTGGNRYMVQPRGMTPDGKLHDYVWCHEQELEQTKAKKIVMPMEEKPGGPSESARRPEPAKRR